MSLINQMLKDLEKRAVKAVQPEAVLSGLQSASGREKPRKKTYWLQLALIALILVWLWNLTYYFRQHSFIQARPAQSPSLSQKSVKTTPLPVAQQFPAPSPAVALTGITMQVQDQLTTLHFLLDHEVFYQVDSDPWVHSIILTLKNTRLSINPPSLDYTHSAISKLKITSDKNGKLVVIFMLKPDAKLMKAELNKKNKDAELQVELMRQTPVVLSPEVPQLKKVALPSSREEQYQEAVEMAQSGQVPSAIHRLVALVQKDPGDLETRETLISLLMREGQHNKAKDLLARGLQLQPDYPPFVQIKARLLVEAGKINQALDLLKKAPPAIRAYPEYYSFIAALYQRLGEFSTAENIYQQLTLLYPEKGVWWLGLGVSEDGLGKTAQAMEAYAKADNSSDLDPALRGYVNTRLRG